MKKIILSLALLFLFPSMVFAKPENPGSPGKGGNDDFQPIPESVCLDPGHGGYDTGAVNNELKESDINLRVADLVKEKLTSEHYNPDNIFMTRTDDSPRSNADRYNYCNSQGVALLISIHHNGSVNPDIDYTMALYSKKEDREIAQLVSEEISRALKLPNYGISRFASGVLLKSKMPATISEGFFLTNTDEYNWIKNANREDYEALAIVSAINIFFGK